MSDQDFNFAPPPRKREKPKPFEPPPWEQDQFAEIERRKAAEKAAEEQARKDEAAGVAAAQAAETVPAPPAETVGAGAEIERGGQPVAPARASGTTAPPAPARPAAPADAAASARSADAMLVQLKGEEPSVGQGIWKVSLAVAFVVAVIGIAVSVVGIAALSKQLGPAGSLGGMVLLVFGMGFVGIGVWVTYQTLRQRGVL